MGESGGEDGVDGDDGGISIDDARVDEMEGDRATMRGEEGVEESRRGEEGVDEGMRGDRLSFLHDMHRCLRSSRMMNE